MRYFFIRTTLVIMVAACAGMAFAAGNVVCLAVLPDGKDAGTRAMADLLCVQLTHHPGLKLAERADIDRIIQEQQLSASQELGRSEQMALGRLLRVDGMVFVKHDAGQKRLRVRLVDTRHGFQVASFQYAASAAPMDKQTHLMAEDVLNATDKLRVDPSDLQWVSIMRIGNATLQADYNWIEDELPVMLAACLSQEPRVLMLERRQMWELAEEARLHAELRAFAGAGVMIDGELSLSMNTEIAGSDMPLTLTLRLRDAALRELGRISIKGRSNAIEVMAAGAIRRIVEHLQTMSHTPSTGVAQLESEELLNIARRHGLVWAAASGHALSATNIDFPKELVNNLVKEAVPLMYTGALPESNDVIVGRAETLARAVALCRDSSAPLLKNIDLDLESKIRHFLKYLEPMLIPEARATLKPVRAFLRLEVENLRGSKRNQVFRHIRWAPAFFDNPLHATLYTINLFDRLEAMPGLSPEDRAHFQVMMMHECYWPQAQYENLLQHTNALIRYFANIKLARFHFRAPREQYNQAALDELPAALAEKHGHGLTYFIGSLVEVGTTTRFYNSIKQLTNACPDAAPVIARLVRDKMEAYLRDGAYFEMLMFRPSLYCDLIPPGDFLPVIEGLLAQKVLALDAIGKVPRFRTDMQCELEALEKYRDEYLEACKGLDLTARVVTSGSDSEWRDLCGQYWAKSDFRRSIFTPQRLLLDGDTLWIGVGRGWWSYWPPAKNLRGDAQQWLQDGPVSPEKLAVVSQYETGLVKLDMRTGKIIGGRHGYVETLPTRVKRDGRDRYSYTSYIILTHMFQFQQYIGYGLSSVGILLFPRDMDTVNGDLRDVEIIKIPERFGSNISKILPCDDTIYVQMGGMDDTIILAWDLQSRALRVIGDISREMDGFAVPDYEVWVRDVFIDEESGKLRLATNMRGIKNNKFGSRMWEYNPVEMQWVCIANSEKPHHIETTVSIKDKVVEKLFAAEETSKCTYDVCNYRQGALAIVGHGPDWRLQEFSFDTNGDLPKNSESEHPGMADLRQAIKDGDLTQIRMLAAGVDLNARTQEGTTPLREAIVCNKPEIVQWLIEQKVEVDDVGVITGRTPLLVAAQRGYLPIVKQLIAAGADRNAKDKWGAPLFVIAARAGTTSVLEWCYNKWPPSQDVLNLALFHAVGWESPENIKWLLAHGATISFVHDYTGTIEHSAKWSTPETFEYLLEKDDDPDDFWRRDEEVVNEGNYVSPLRGVMFANRPDNLRVLLEHGASLEKAWRESSLNYSAQQASKPEQRNEIVSIILEEYGKLIMRRLGDDH